MPGSVRPHDLGNLSHGLAVAAEMHLRRHRVRRSRCQHGERLADVVHARVRRPLRRVPHGLVLAVLGVKAEPRPDRVLEEQARVDATHTHVGDELLREPEVRLLGVPLVVREVVHVVVNAELGREIEPHGGARDAAQERLFEVVAAGADAGEGNKRVC